MFSILPLLVLRKQQISSTMLFTSGEMNTLWISIQRFPSTILRSIQRMTNETSLEPFLPPKYDVLAPFPELSVGKVCSLLPGWVKCRVHRETRQFVVQEGIAFSSWVGKWSIFQTLMAPCAISGRKKERTRKFHNERIIHFWREGQWAHYPRWPRIEAAFSCAPSALNSPPKGKLFWTLFRPFRNIRRGK